MVLVEWPGASLDRKEDSMPITSQQRTKMQLHLARFVEAMTAWNWSKKTVISYDQNVRAFFTWLEQETEAEALTEVSPDIVASYQMALLSMEKRNGEHLSVGTQHQRLTAIKSFFRFLVTEGKVLTNPTAAVTLPKKRVILPQPLVSAKETIRMLDRIDTSTPMGLRDRAVVELLYSTGIRNAELRAVKVTDFDPHAEIVIIIAGKGNKDRVVPLGPVATTIISDYIAQARPKLSKRPNVPNLFLTKNGHALDTLSVINIVKRATKNAGITKPVRPHRLRHACATHMLKGGADIRHIQKLLGHATLQTTQIYTRVEIGDLKAVHRRFHPRERGSRR
jgi:integrase/recombinase XerD